MRIKLAVAGVVMVATVAAGDDAAILKSIQQQAQKCADTVVKEDFTTLADMTHPTVLEKVGGKEKMIDKLRSEMANMKAKGFKFLSAKADAPTMIVRSGGTWFAVLLTHLELEVPGAKIKGKSFLLAVSADEGKKWWFVDGSPGADKIRKVIPGIPKDMKLPEKEPPVIEKTK